VRRQADESLFISQEEHGTLAEKVVRIGVRKIRLMVLTQSGGPGRRSLDGGIDADLSRKPLIPANAGAGL
jgi:hypothetical protein